MTDGRAAARASRARRRGQSTNLDWALAAIVDGGMARSVRIEFPGAYYHVMALGNRREEIFVDDDDRRYFLKAVSGIIRGESGQ